MRQQVDVRGLSCPQPVILTKNAIDKGEFPIVILLDTITSIENVKRMAEKEGCDVKLEEMDDEFKLTITT